jgi:hypothetical protein
MTKLRFRTWATSLRRVSAMLGLALLASCGGELALLLAAPGVGTGGTGIIAGVLTGLGSVVVDGQRYDESQATLEQRARSGNQRVADRQRPADWPGSGTPVRREWQSQPGAGGSPTGRSCHPDQRAPGSLHGLGPERAGEHPCYSRPGNGVLGLWLVGRPERSRCGARVRCTWCARALGH